MSETGGSPGESVGAGRERTGRLGGFAGAVGALTMIAGLVTMGALPGSDATAPQVYEFFLAEDGEVARPTALIAIGLLLALVMFATLRAMMSGRRGSNAAGVTMLALAQIGIGLQVVALTMIGVLTLRPADADPGTSRAILDLSELLAGISGAALAAALIATALGIRRTPGLLPPRFSEAALLAAVGVALWTVRLFSDAGAFAADSFLGSTLGWILLDAWLLAAGLWLLAIRPRRVVLPDLDGSPGDGAEEAPRPVPRPSAPQLSRAERAKAKMPAATPTPVTPRRRPPTLPSQPPPKPRKPFVPPPYPEPEADEPEPPSAAKPGTPPDEPATVPPEPESGKAAGAGPMPESMDDLDLGPRPAPPVDPEPEPAPEPDTEAEAEDPGDEPQ